LEDSVTKPLLDHLNEIAPKNHGTVVHWDNVDRLLADDGGRVETENQRKEGAKSVEKRAEKEVTRLKRVLKQHLAMTFQRFLDPSDKRVPNVQINVNGDYIEPWDPFQKKYSDVVYDETWAVTGSTKGIQVRAFVMPRPEDWPGGDKGDAYKLARVNLTNQGIYFYREHRCLKPATYEGVTGLKKETHLNNLRIEFSFDHESDRLLAIDTKKSTIRLTGDLVERFQVDLVHARREADRRSRKGSNLKSQEKSKSAHDQSNRAIQAVDSTLGGVKVGKPDPKTGKSEVTGKFAVRLMKNIEQRKPGQVHIQPVDGIDDGLLYQPVIINPAKRAVQINTQHPFYRKVYRALMGSSVDVMGVDMLLYTLGQAELDATSDETVDTFFEMRYELSKNLRKLVKSLPEPSEDD